MSDDYVQTFNGRFTFADAHCLEAGLDRFAAALENSLVDFDDLAFDELSILIDVGCPAPEEVYDDTRHALRELAAEAKSGSLVATFSLDAPRRDHVHSGGRSDSSGLAPRHHRWELWAAAKAGDAVALRELQSRGVALDQRFVGYRNWSVLHVAAASGSAEAVQLLLDAGIAADSLALEIAIERRLRDVAAVLLDAGATISESSRKTIVNECVYVGDVGTLQRLLGRDSEISSLLREPNVMDLAIASGEVVLVDLLLEHGATLPESFIVAAIRSGSVAILELAMSNPNAREQCGPSSKYLDGMCYAASKGRLDMMQVFARHGVPLFPEQPGEVSPLHGAARSYEDGAIACVTWLLDQGVPIELLDQEGCTPLQKAGEYYRPAAAKLLLERGADPSVLARLSNEARTKLREHLGPSWVTLFEKKKKARKKS